MEYAIIALECHTVVFSDEDIQTVQTKRADLSRQGIATALVAVLETALDNKPECRDALQDIINSANANPTPIHYNVRAAIDRARDLLRG